MKTVTDYQKDIQDAEAAIAKLQALCLHNQGYECVMWSYRPGSSWPSRICLTCRVPMMGITPEEEIKAQEWSRGTVTITNQEVS